MLFKLNYSNKKIIIIIRVSTKILYRSIGEFLILYLNIRIPILWIKNVLNESILKPVKIQVNFFIKNICYQNDTKTLSYLALNTMKYH